MMKLLFIFGLFSGIFYVTVVGDEKDEALIKHILDDDDEVYKSVFGNRTVKYRDKDIKEIKEIVEKHEKRHQTKIYTKIIGGIIALFVIGGILYCYKAMCKRKRAAEALDREAVVPALPPESVSPYINPYPPQQPPYPLEQSFTDPQQTPYFPPQPPYPNHQGSNPQYQAPYPLQQAPYPQQQAPYPQNQAPYPQNQAPYPQNQPPYPQNQRPYPKNQPPYPLQQAPYPGQQPVLPFQQNPDQSQQTPYPTSQEFEHPPAYDKSGAVVYKTYMWI